MARVYLKGLPQLKAKLIKLKNETIGKVRTAMEQAATEIVATMKNLAPVEDGDLRNSIGWTWGDAPNGSISMSHTVQGNTITIYAGDEKAFYARWVEFGTKAHNVAKGGGNKSFKGQGRQHPGAQAKPFFYVSYRAHKKAAKLQIRKAISVAVREAIK